MAVFRNVNVEIAMTTGPKMPRFERRVDMAETDDAGHWVPLPMTVRWLIDGVEVTEAEFRDHPQSPLPAEGPR